MRNIEEKEMQAELFCCPLCGSPFHREGQSVRCENRHCFDRAAEGYLHLLPASRMNSRLPGDNKEMVSSRRAFLETGGYQLFSDGINRAVSGHLRGRNTPVVLDAGCGEGYYTGRLFAALRAEGVAASLCGVDISKAAVKAAAKRYRGISFAVASSFSLPVPAGSCDCVTDVFAPVVAEEFARVLKPDGLFLLAVPSGAHLFGLKEILYDKPYYNEKTDTDYPGFAFLERIALRDTLVLEDAAMIQNLFSMTPYYWKTSAEGCARLKETVRLVTPIGFDLLLYRRI